MSHSTSPTTRNSLFGWAKGLKRGHFVSNDSLNEISSDESISKSPTKGITIQHSASQPINYTSSHQPNIPNFGSSPTTTQQATDLLRPLLNAKSKSNNNIDRVRSNSLNQSENSLRQHRDSFLQHNSLVDENSKYFGVPLQQALDEAFSNISIQTGDESQGLQYGQIPIVVAKCGVFLKKHGLVVEGIFRVGGSSKRLKELQVIFNTAPLYGRNLNWDGYTVHDAASILRRYLNALPEPLIPLEMYELFRDPLRSRQRIINYMKYKAENPSKSILATTSFENSNSNEVLDLSQPLTEANIGRLNSSDSGANFKDSENTSINPVYSTTEQQQQQPQSSDDENNAEKPRKKSKTYKKLTSDVHAAINEYKELVNDLPIASRQLLFYIMDLLAMVQNHSQENLMSSRNLAAIFQPSILSHPNHDLDPVEYALSQLVVEFLIQYAYKLLPQYSSTPKKEEEAYAEEEEDILDAKNTPKEPITEIASPESNDDTKEEESKPEEEPKDKEQEKSDDCEFNQKNRENIIGYQHNVTTSIPFESDVDEYDLSDANDIGSDLEELHFQQLHNQSGSINSLKQSENVVPPIVISPAETRLSNAV
ncbi:GTPase-activating protein SAC7 [Spathaspora sp. JA1]|nr:GTPase-activating protein SAC7 [Spathaspora sp. JA1]